MAAQAPQIEYVMAAPPRGGEGGSGVVGLLLAGGLAFGAYKLYEYYEKQKGGGGDDFRPLQPGQHGHKDPDPIPGSWQPLSPPGKAPPAWNPKGWGPGLGPEKPPKGVWEPEPGSWKPLTNPKDPDPGHFKGLSPGKAPPFDPKGWGSGLGPQKAPPGLQDPWTPIPGSWDPLGPSKDPVPGSWEPLSPGKAPPFDPKSWGPGLGPEKPPKGVWEPEPGSWKPLGPNRQDPDPGHFKGLSPGKAPPFDPKTWGPGLGPERPPLIPGMLHPLGPGSVSSPVPLKPGSVSNPVPLQPGKNPDPDPGHFKPIHPLDPDPGHFKGLGPQQPQPIYPASIGTALSALDKLVGNWGSFDNAAGTYYSYYDSKPVDDAPHALLAWADNHKSQGFPEPAWDYTMAHYPFQTQADKCNFARLTKSGPMPNYWNSLGMSGQISVVNYLENNCGGA